MPHPVQKWEREAGLTPAHPLPECCNSVICLHFHKAQQNGLSPRRYEVGLPLCLWADAGSPPAQKATRASMRIGRLPLISPGNFCQAAGSWQSPFVLHFYVRRSRRGGGRGEAPSNQLAPPWLEGEPASPPAMDGWSCRGVLISWDQLGDPSEAMETEQTRMERGEGLFQRTGCRHLAAAAEASPGRRGCA